MAGATGAATNAAELAGSYHQELRFDDDRMPVSTPSDSSEQENAPMEKDEQLKGTKPKPMVEDLTNADSHELSAGGSSQPRGAPILTSAAGPNDVVKAFIATTVVPDTRPVQPAAQLSIFKPTTIFKHHPVALRKPGAQQSLVQQRDSSNPERSLPHGGLKGLAIVAIVGAWLLCALLRSLVRSMANGEPVRVSWIMSDMIVAVVLAVVTSAGFHVSLGGRVEVREGWVQRTVEAFVKVE